MFNVIRIPTKFSKSIRRLTRNDKAELLDMLMNIGDGIHTIPPDTNLGDILELIYGEWMNMESRNGNKPIVSLISKEVTDSLGTEAPTHSEHRVEYNRVEENKIKEIKHRYGEFEKVLLSDEELEKLKIRYDTKDLDELINKLDIYIGSKGVSYKSHYLTIINWAKKKGVQEYTQKDREEQKEREQKRKAILETAEELPEFKTQEKKISLTPQEQQRKYAEMKKQYFNN